MRMLQSSNVYNAGFGSTLMLQFLPLNRGRLDLRLALFLAIVAAGAIAGFATGSGEDSATRLVLAGVGALIGAAIAGAVLKLGGIKGSNTYTGGAIPGSGVTSEDLAANYWRDKGHPPFMKPPEGDPPSRGPD
ncbi:TPA: hypothetical protein NI628_006935 [Pseudomonas aeruginosa]|jgi:ABC-type Fe3+-siderophore transport system permease subunit|nr:hypothetical protein [Piscinibacter defluvii]MCK6423275.1 hypothetical protein [Aquabacterium sp.]HCF9151639.1 hypothetical protein [Pseudomonas aeruginosa]HCF9179139.1 hypothetical protein [Pseudomonas aeruginosa]HCF9186391.1 hypothetical protein [Pseudomonas aeruginosa]HCF9193642.1 hypothetical protein [Pseudomonas aeruginosa]